MITENVRLECMKHRDTISCSAPVESTLHAAIKHANKTKISCSLHDTDHIYEYMRVAPFNTFSTYVRVGAFVNRNETLVTLSNPLRNTIIANYLTMVASQVQTY